MIPTSSMIDRIKKLMALTDRGTPHEAALAAERMQTLLQECNLTRADIESRSSDELLSPSVDRERQEQIRRPAIYKWQKDLMRTIAENNFCMHFITRRMIRDAKGRGYIWDERLGGHVLAREVKRHVLIGRSDNVAATTLMFDYLVDTMEKLIPYKGVQRKTTQAMDWLNGCTETLCARLTAQRTGKQMEEPKEHMPGIVRLSELYGTEQDLNEDYRHGLKPGTTAQKRRDAQAAELAEKVEIERKEKELLAQGVDADDVWYLARGHEAPSREPQKITKQRKSSSFGYSRSTGWTQKDQREWDRRNSNAFNDGKRRGHDIGLGGSIKSGVKGEIE